FVAEYWKGPPATLQTHSVRMNFRPGSLPRFLVCHSRRAGFSDLWPTMGFFTTASLKWSITAAMENAPPSRSYRVASGMGVTSLWFSMVRWAPTTRLINTFRRAVMVKRDQTTLRPARPRNIAPLWSRQLRGGILLRGMDDRCRCAGVALNDIHPGFQIPGKRLDDAGSEADMLWPARSE